MMIQQHSSMDSKEESTICTCCFIPYWSCNGKNKLARHLLAMSVVCFYACNDTLNSVVDSPTPPPPSSVFIPFQRSSASKIVRISARFVFFVYFRPRFGLRCGGILQSHNSFHVAKFKGVRGRVCLCAFHCCHSLGTALRVQTTAMGCRDPRWPLAQLEESHLFFFCPEWERPVVASGKCSVLRHDAALSFDNQ
ncbi:hypothetical protein GOODEAATRI_003720 [Goodea atripinnis]|uniref:Uncharacterized protein n=1 Tax=Goodea atripinnis TaxID=208336 RepID=A0ABV0MZW5_9TELE